MNVSWKPFDTLTARELYAILSLRVDVFMLEQDCLYQELDGKDDVATHLLLTKDEKLLGYARVLFDKEKNALSFGRLVNQQSLRGQGIGKRLMSEIMRYFKAHHNHTPIVISAQCYLENFYRQYGFLPQGEPYLEDGLPHIQMKHTGHHDNNH